MIRETAMPSIFQKHIFILQKLLAQFNFTAVL